MKLPIIFVNIVAAVTINGQFLEAEFNVGSVPLNLNRGFEIRQSVDREIPTRAGGVAQGRRLVDTQRIMRNGPQRNVNNFDTRQDQRESQSDGDETAPLDRQPASNRGRNENRANTFNAQTQEANVAAPFTNNNRQRVTVKSGTDNFGNRDAYAQRDSQTNDRAYESYGNRQNDRNENRPNSNTRQDDRYDGAFVSGDVRTSTLRTNLDSGPSRDGPVLYTNEGRKTLQDNELSVNGSKSDDKWVRTNEGPTTTKGPIIPTVDDRASFTGDQCPTGKVKFNNSCVEKD